MPWRTTARRAASTRGKTRAAALLSVCVIAGLPSAVAATPRQPSTWNFAQIRIGQSQPAGRDGAGVVVAVVDTWVDRAHPDLGGRVMTGADCANAACTKGNVAADACEAHGTPVAGTVASSTYGVAPAARILPLRVLRWNGKECTGDSRDVAAAVRYATANGARVVNLSIGAAVPLAGSDATLDDAVADAAAAGVLVVFAAGNQNLPVADSYGGNALIVAATARNGRLASYSQHGAGIDLAAPGGDTPTDTCDVEGCVVSTWSDGTNHQFAALAGTSMAAPHVSGVAALLFAQRSRTRSQVIARLRDTARPLANAGDGIIDASAALGVSASPRPTATSAPPSPKVVRVQPRARPPARTATPAPKPTATRTPTPKPTPTLTPAPVPSPTTAPPAAAPYVVAEPPAAPVSRTVPVGLAVMLVLAAAGGTALSASSAARR